MNCIVVIEDQFEVRDNLAEILELSGYKVYQAADGATGVTAVQTHLPDLILCDVMMPRLDGYGVLKILRADPATRHIPFVFLTAKSENVDVRKGMGLGADDYLIKPFDDVDLLETIRLRIDRMNLRSSQLSDDTRSDRHFFDEKKARERLHSLFADGEEWHYKSGDTLYREQTACHWIYRVQSGRVKSIRQNSIGKSLLSVISTKGHLVGYVPALSTEIHHDTAKCMEDTTVRVIPIRALQDLLLNDAEASMLLLRDMAQHIDECQNRVLDMAYSSVRRKVATAILSVIPDPSDSTTITREDLSQIAGVAKETLIRTLSDFKSTGIISTADDIVKVLNRKALVQMPQ